VRGGWRRQIETYRRLHALPGVEVVLGMTLSAHNADQYERAFAAARAACPWLTPQDYHLNVVHESAHYYGNEGAEGLGEREAEARETLRRYRTARGRPRGPVGWLEHTYLRKAEQYLDTGVTPMRCHALRASCFVDPRGQVYPCGMYDRVVADLREHEYDLGVIWRLPETRALQRGIWDYRCPQCWTPCEAYQSIFGNLLGLRNTPRDRRPPAESPAE
jgi:radical SAM protein with 4Fe4S-binding SPASM domain